MSGQAGIKQDGVFCSPAILLPTFLSARFSAAHYLIVLDVCLLLVPMVWQRLRKAASDSGRRIYRLCAFSVRERFSITFA
jgi:hypothetical protein